MAFVLVCMMMNTALANGTKRLEFGQIDSIPNFSAYPYFLKKAINAHS